MIASYFYRMAITAPRVSLSPDSCNRFAAAVSTWLLVEGIWGFFSREVFGLLTTNPLHAAIHVALGGSGLWASFTGRAVLFLWVLGLLLLAVGVLFFVPATRELIAVLNVNAAVAILNLVLGGLSVLWAIRCSR